VVVDSGLHELLYGAIRNKRLIRFRYKNKERTVEPPDYGIQDGIIRLLSWQIGGQSNGRLPGWRWFDVGGMQDVEVLDKSFPGNREVSGKHHRWHEIFVRVGPSRKSRFTEGH
jgi:hypothetical protein